MDPLEPHMEIQNIVQGHNLLCIVPVKERLHPGLHFFGRHSLHIAYLVFQQLVIANFEPVLSGIGCSAFKNKMKLLDKTLGKL